MRYLLTKTFEGIERLIFRYRRLMVAIVFLLQATLANYLAFALRFDFLIGSYYFRLFVDFLPLLLFVRLVFFLQSGLYKDLWRYASINDLTRLLGSVFVGSVVFFVLVRYVFHGTAYPRSIYILDLLLMVILAGGSRLAIRVFKEYLHMQKTGRKVLIIGAGDAGEMIVRDMKNNPFYEYSPVGFIDDAPYKQGLSIHGVPIFGPRSKLQEVIEKHAPEEILITMPSASHHTLRQLYDLCKPFHLPIKTLPGISRIIKGEVTVSQIKPLSLEDLLQREQIRTDIESVQKYLEGRSVLVTGAGGSIGSELARQIAYYRPSSLVMLDRYENGLFDINLLLTSAFPELKSIPVICDVTDKRSLERVFSTYRPEIVFHAAAHKHVTLMEGNPVEAARNNVLGTLNVLDASERHEVDGFIMISTDKAVNPANVMGATKRVAEVLTLLKNSQAKGRYVTVRFGNVLGSNGSVVNIFKKQLEAGGPLTVTHPEIKRFFMLIPEAVQLVLTAAAEGGPGDVFVLNMGEPIRIIDLAENLIRLSGFVPGEDVQIKYTGLRPGEKMYEELFDWSEKTITTGHRDILVAEPDPEVVTRASQYLDELYSAIDSTNGDTVVDVLARMIPGFRQDSP